MTSDVSTHDLTLTRILDAPRSLVYRAWTDPQHLARWWGPHGFTAPECRADVRPGGEIYIRMVGHGFDHAMQGRFVEVVEPKRVVFDSWLDDETGTTFLEIRNTVTLEEHGAGKTALTLHAHVVYAGTGSEGPLSGMEEGWDQSLERLGTYVSGLRPQKITPFLWFDGRAEEAMHFYTSVFPDARVVDVVRYTEAGPGKPGTVMGATFELAGQRFFALNGGPQFPFTEAISFFVDCETQAEIDTYWERLCEAGTPVQCGWLKDKFGLSWQIVPRELHAMLRDSNPKKAAAVMRALMEMIKLDIADLRKAYEMA